MILWFVHIVITGQFNFAIGGDGTIYELNGFDSVAKHANFYDNISLGMYIVHINFIDILWR